MDLERDMQESAALKRLGYGKQSSVLGRLMRRVRQHLMETLDDVRGLLPWDTLDRGDAVAAICLFLFGVVVVALLLAAI